MLRIIWIAEMLFNAHFRPDKDDKSFYRFKRDFVKTCKKARTKKKVNKIQSSMERNKPKVKKKYKSTRLIPQDSFVEEERKLRAKAKKLLAQCKEMEAQKTNTHQWVSEKYKGCKTRWLKRKVITL